MRTAASKFHRIDRVDEKGARAVVIGDHLADPIGIGDDQHRQIEEPRIVADLRAEIEIGGRVGLRHHDGRVEVIVTEQIIGFIRVGGEREARPGEDAAQRGAARPDDQQRVIGLGIDARQVFVDRDAEPPGRRRAEMQFGPHDGQAYQWPQVSDQFVIVERRRQDIVDAGRQGLCLERRRVCRGGDADGYVAASGNHPYRLGQRDDIATRNAFADQDDVRPFLFDGGQNRRLAADRPAVIAVATNFVQKLLCQGGIVGGDENVGQVDHPATSLSQKEAQ